MWFIYFSLRFSLLLSLKWLKVLRVGSRCASKSLRVVPSFPRLRFTYHYKQCDNLILMGCFNVL